VSPTPILSYLLTGVLTSWVDALGYSCSQQQHKVLTTSLCFRLVHKHLYIITKGHTVQGVSLYKHRILQFYDFCLSCFFISLCASQPVVSLLPPRQAGQVRPCCIRKKWSLILRSAGITASKCSCVFSRVASFGLQPHKPAMR
jgi:hypothetical protein